MEGVYNEGSVYTIDKDYLMEIPYTSSSQISGSSYDGLNTQKQIEFGYPIRIIPIGFDTKKQEVIVSSSDMTIKKKYGEIYAIYSEQRSRVVEEVLDNLPFLARISKENFISHAKLIIM